ncbi:MAG TPA: 16S rRNA (uracil(1498)-N(3))-methyltransferase [Pyrinomonadaceae bacterium]|nr:16S rRNA (uracil(1498)-N(3))-methyltransferase [Pyrinomonadaceae bacterium]
MRRFYSPNESFNAENITLNIDETKHLREVLRLRVGEKVQVFDGEGNEFLCEIESISKKETLLKIVEEIKPFAPISNLDLTLAVALLKGDKFDLVVQKAVELGVKTFVPLMTKRCDVKIKNAQDFNKKLERLNRIALEACKQSGRADLMEITELIGFQEFIKSANGTKLFFSERKGESFNEIKPDKKITALIGSEGGWEDSEIESAIENGFQIITFGGRILRAETAAISIATILQHRFGDLN